MNIRDVLPSDAGRIAEIYNYYIRETTITFELEEVSSKEIETRIANTASMRYPWLVIENDQGRVEGYAYACRWRTREAYQHTVESTVYLDHQSTGNGFGRAIYSALLDRLKAAGRFHVVLGGITYPNEASEKLHRSLGFTDAARFAQVGRKFGRWLDVIWLQLALGASGECEDA